MNSRDRVKCVTATTGTGTVTLGAAVTGYRTFLSAYSANMSNVTYVIEDGAAWETGTGTFNFANNTLTRAIDASSTGALLNLSGNATIGITFLARENVADWPFFEVISANGNGGTDGEFTTIRFDTVIADTNSGWNASTNIYTVPQYGTYDALLKFRISDGNRAGKSYGLGVDTANQDSAAFSWFQGAPNRQGAEYRRVSVFPQGAQIRAFYYMDGVGAGYTTADLVIFRVR